MMNFVRFLSGLPDDLTLDTSLTDSAQHGAVLLAAVDSLIRNPQIPVGMDQNFFDIGNSSINFSHISLGYTSFESSIQDGYMPDRYMMSFLGHRRLILYPPLKKIVGGSKKNRKPRERATF